MRREEQVDLVPLKEKMTPHLQTHERRRRQNERDSGLRKQRRPACGQLV